MRMILRRASQAAVIVFLVCLNIIIINAKGCPPSDSILPCRCSEKGEEMQIWCSHSNLPQVLEGVKALARSVKRPIDELILENNQLPALPGRFFAPLKVQRLMLRHNNVERLSNGWLNELEDNLVEIFIVERFLRSIPGESLNGLNKLEAITIHSEELKRLPDFSGLLSLKYLHVQSSALIELQPVIFRHLPYLETIYVNGGKQLSRLESGLFDNLPSLKTIDLSRNGINWIHIRALYHLPRLATLKLSGNQLSDVGMIGRVVKDLNNLEKLRLDKNLITVLSEGSFVDLPLLRELHLNDNRISEIQYGSFHRTPNLRLVLLQNNRIRRIHPESFLQSSGSGVETLFLQNNEIDRVEELRSLLDALPTMKFLDMSNNFLVDIPFGALRGHGTIEQLHLDNNLIQSIDRDALMAMPGLRELRLRNNSLSETLPMPFWNLPGLKGLDLSLNRFRKIDSLLLAGLPSLRRLDLSQNFLISLDPSSFLHNPMMETLNISFNEIEFIHPTTFQNLDRLFEIDASNNQLKDMIAGLPEILERISVRNNKILSLPISSSKSLNLPNLRMLDLSQNNLEYIPKFTFQALQQLRVLSIADNRLRALEDSTFQGTERLEMLLLQNNQISQIQDRSLNQMRNLRDLNLQGNKIEMLTDNFFFNTSNLEQLDVSRNGLRELTPMIFKNLKQLKYLDLSGNNLVDIPDSLSLLSNLIDIDVSSNRLAYLPPSVIGSWKTVVDVRLSDNQIAELKRGTFQNLPKVQYIDLSSNEIHSLEPSAFKSLPELQELVLADNKLIEIKDHVFEEIPNLQATHLQHNALKYISPDSFYKAPSMVYLNLSANEFRTMENIGLRSMRNLEVLDLSFNELQKVSTMPLQALNWLVELKLDNNLICKVQGEPFTTMPRLRVLSMRNNRMRSMSERTFRNLRGNIAVLDIDGNPVSCSCEMLWLSVWLEESNSENQGPICPNGKSLRSSRLDKSDCSDRRMASNQLPLMNDHGDVFLRQLSAEFEEECDRVVTGDTSQHPSPAESEYFYDQYIDYPVNESQPSPISSGPKQPGAPVSSSVPMNLNNTILNYNLYNKPRPPHPVTPQLTFFGYPLPNLGVGKILGLGRKKDGRIQTPPTRGKVRMFRPNDAEFERFLNQGHFNDATSRNSGGQYTELSSGESQISEEQTFRTPFKNPSVEKGGFSPMLPSPSGGFVPIKNPYISSHEFKDGERTTRTPLDTESPSDNVYEDSKHDNMVPVITEVPPKRHFTGPTTMNSFDANEFEEKFTTTSNHFDRSTVDGDRTSTITYTEKDETFVTHPYPRKIPTYFSTSDSPTNTPSTQNPNEDEINLTSTPETILLIPPSSELDQYTKANYGKYWEEARHDRNVNEQTETRSKSRLPLGRPIITKVFTPQTPNLPTAEEYFRTTADANRENGVRLDEFVTTSYSPTEEPGRKHGMEWYYENYQNLGGNHRRGYDDSADNYFGLKNGHVRSNTNGSQSFIILIFLNYLVVRIISL